MISKVMAGIDVLKAKDTISYSVTMAIRVGQAQLEGTGAGTTVPSAKEEAAKHLFPQMLPLLERAQKGKAEDKQKDGLRAETAFDPCWIATASYVAQPFNIDTADFERMRIFVDANKAEATNASASGRKHYLGMDSEGHASKRAKYMQIAAHLNQVNVAVVFPTTGLYMAMVKELFMHPHIIMIVMDLSTDCGMLKPCFDDDAETAAKWMLSVVDVQPIAHLIMGGTDSPSLAGIVEYLREIDLPQPLAKFYKHTTGLARSKAYAPFEDQKSSLPTDLIIYAGLDAIVTKWVFDEFMKRRPQQVQEVQQAQLAQRAQEAQEA